jgi:hypothetical protein
MNGSILVRARLAMGYPYEIPHRIVITKIVVPKLPPAKQQKTIKYQRDISSDVQNANEYFSVPPGQYKVVLMRLDDLKSPRAYKNITVADGEDVIVNLQLPTTEARVKLNLKILPKGQNVIGLRLNMLTPYNTSDPNENSYRWFGVTPITTKNKDGFFVSASQFVPCPSGNYKISEAFTSTLAVKIPSPAGLAVHGVITPTKLITVNTGKLQTAFYFDVSKTEYYMGFVRTRIRCVSGNNSYVIDAVEGMNKIEVVPGTYTISYDRNFSHVMSPNPIWEPLDQLVIGKNQIVFANYAQTCNGQLNCVAFEVYRMTDRWPWSDKF